MYYDEETQKAKSKKQIILKELRRANSIIKRIAEKHDTKAFINKVDALQRNVNNLFSDLFLLSANEYRKISYKKDDFEKFVNNAWAYCQNDLRIEL